MDHQNVLTKFAKKFASTEKESVYRGIHYRSDGSVAVTNREYALRIKNAHELDQNVVLHAVTGMPLKGDYADLDRVFPTSFDNEIAIAGNALPDVIKRARIAADIAKRINSKFPTVTIEAVNGATHLKIKDADQQLEFSTFFGNTQKVESSKRTLNAEYLHTALSVFAEAGSAKVMIKFGKPLSPIVLTDGRDIDIVVLPYRVAV